MQNTPSLAHSQTDLALVFSKPTTSAQPLGGDALNTYSAAKNSISVVPQISCSRLNSDTRPFLQVHSRTQ